MNKQILELKKINEAGYVLIKVENKWVLEHVFVVSQFLGRELTKDEIVHHIDFDKTNNQIENLALFTKKQHSHFHRQIKQFGYTNPRRLEVFNNLIQVKLREKSIC
jgi:hypothetical protein